MESIGWVVAAAAVVAAIVLAQRAAQAWARLAAAEGRVAAEVEQRVAQALLEAREAADARRDELEAEVRAQRTELTGRTARLEAREESLDRRDASQTEREEILLARRAELDGRLGELVVMGERYESELARLAGLTAEEARAEAIETALEAERPRIAAEVQRIESEARRDANHRARDVVVDAIQRTANELVNEVAVSVVPLPSDEVKGRIIGREGRNVRTFEQVTGVDVVIDDTPEVVVLSSFDPLRREVARAALEALIVDGRIHPARIEEVVERARRDLDERLQEEAEAALVATGVGGMSRDLMHLLGQLRFRTSYSQNVLAHSIETGKLAGLMAEELGLDAALARRAGLLHDIGKAADAADDQPHAQVGADLAAAHGESAAVCAAIASHHGESEAGSPEAQLVAAADALSAGRPGARRDNLADYLRRLERLEELAVGFEGVERAYAIQAGREVRVLVRPEQVGEGATQQLAGDLARRIETDLEYPGQVKVTVIREQRATDYAR